MRKRILEGIAGIGLLAVLPACSTQKQAIMPEDVYAVARTVQTGTEQEAGSDNRGKYPGMWKSPSCRSMPSLFITG